MLLYDESTIGTTDNQITFNDEAATPFYRLTGERIVGREIDSFDIKIPESMGTADFQTLMGKVNYILEGTMYPEDEVTYDEGIKALRKLGSFHIAQDDANSDAGYVPFKFTEYDGVDKQINLKVMYADLPKRTKNGLKQPFRLFCKVKYPVSEGQDSITVNLGSSTATTSGSSNLSKTLPLAFGLTTYTSNGTATNVGDLDVYPTITVFGPITTPRVTNSTTSEYIELTGLSLASGSDSVIITYDQDTLSITQAGTSKLNLLTSSSDLFKIVSGTNNLTLTGATVGSGAYATVSFRPAWPLS